MLVLSRKTDQTIVLGSNIVLTVVAVKGNRVKIGIDAPTDVRVLRGELPGFAAELEERVSLELDVAGQGMISSSAALTAPR